MIARALSAMTFGVILRALMLSTSIFSTFDVMLAIMARSSSETHLGVRTRIHSSGVDGIGKVVMEKHLTKHRRLQKLIQHFDQVHELPRDANFEQAFTLSVTLLHASFVSSFH